ncbi:hypothetical protein ZEAMMB73_Zm00001d004241 [Zea mays]|uniref:Uncharacterized protein n=1 Tax=Zea mays TaxID=4577 RepID=A0A1D6EEM9_MAIZE|nr:hypothetical protein ZEAMMB73_Zm00001d004241 [Zea mays]
MYYLADEPGVHFVWQPNKELSVLAMLRAFNDYYIKDCGIISPPEGDLMVVANAGDSRVVLGTASDNGVVTPSSSSST